MSYTKSLEARIAALEAELEKVRNEAEGQKAIDQKLKVEDVETKVPLERVARHSSGSQDGKETLDLARDIEGLTMEDDGRISFHGPTSLFQLPSGIPQENLNPVQMELELNGRKERLINNAWRERAFEQLATIPVSVFPGLYAGETWSLITVFRSRSIISSIHTGAGSNHYSISCIGQHLPVSVKV